MGRTIRGLFEMAARLGKAATSIIMDAFMKEALPKIRRRALELTMIPIKATATKGNGFKTYHPGKANKSFPMAPITKGSSRKALKMAKAGISQTLVSTRAISKMASSTARVLSRTSTIENMWVNGEME